LLIKKKRRIRRKKKKTNKNKNKNKNKKKLQGVRVAGHRAREGRERIGTNKPDKARFRPWLDHFRYERLGRGAVRAENAQGTPTPSHISPSILVHENKLFPPRSAADLEGVRVARCEWECESVRV